MRLNNIRFPLKNKMNLSISGDNINTICRWIMIIIAILLVIAIGMMIYRLSRRENYTSIKAIHSYEPFKSNQNYPETEDKEKSV